MFTFPNGVLSHFLLSNILDFEPCDFQLQRAYCFAAALQFFKVGLDCAITCTIWFEAHSRSLESPLPHFQARRELITDVRSRGRDRWPPGCLLQTVNIYSIHFSDLQLCYFYLIMFDCLSVYLSICFCVYCCSACQARCLGFCTLICWQSFKQTDIW